MTTETTERDPLPTRYTIGPVPIARLTYYYAERLIAEELPGYTVEYPDVLWAHDGNGMILFHRIGEYARDEFDLIPAHCAILVGVRNTDDVFHEFNLIGRKPREKGSKADAKAWGR